MRRWQIVVAAVLVTAVGLAGALGLGGWAFNTRRYLAHEKRLQGLLAQHPPRSAVREAFRREGTIHAGAAETRAPLEALAPVRPPERRNEVLDKGSHAALTDVFRAGDMTYFIYYDARGAMTGFTCVSP